MSTPPSIPAPAPLSFAAQAVALYGADLHWFLLSRLKNEQDARDVAQEVYLRLLRLGKGELVRQPHAYIYFVACQVLAQFRLRAREDLIAYDSRLARVQDLRPDEPQPDQVANGVMALNQAERLLDALPAMHRRVFVMRTFDGLSWKQIAERLGISPHTVKKYLCEANARISVASREM